MENNYTTHVHCPTSFLSSASLPNPFTTKKEKKTKKRFTLLALQEFHQTGMCSLRCDLFSLSFPLFLASLVLTSHPYFASLPRILISLPYFLFSFLLHGPYFSSDFSSLLLLVVFLKNLSCICLILSFSFFHSSSDISDHNFSFISRSYPLLFSNFFSYPILFYYFPLFI